MRIRKLTYGIPDQRTLGTIFPASASSASKNETINFARLKFSIETENHITCALATACAHEIHCWKKKFLKIYCVLRRIMESAKRHLSHKLGSFSLPFRRNTFPFGVSALVEFKRFVLHVKKKKNSEKCPYDGVRCTVSEQCVTIVISSYV